MKKTKKKKTTTKKGVKAQSRSHLETPALMLRLLSVTRMRSVCVAFILALSLPEQNILH